MGEDAVQNRLIKYFSVLLFCASCASKPVYINHDNMDYGLPKVPDEKEIFNIETENWDIYGISSIETFYIDVNNDGKKDKIIRGRFSNISAHGYDFYEIYSDNGTEIAKFRTVEGADCFLEAYKFQFNPFLLIKASRPWHKTWATPMPAKIERYQIIDDKLEKISETVGGIICDVRELL
jgi:hypothetical protein